MTCPNPQCRAVREAAEALLQWIDRTCLARPVPHLDYHLTALRAALAQEPAPGLRCPCGKGRCVPVPTCPACGEQWIGEDESRALDAATDPSVFEERRAKREALMRASTKASTEALATMLARFHDGKCATTRGGECDCVNWSPAPSTKEKP